MGSWALLTPVIAIVYGIVAIRTIGLIWRGRQSLADNVFTEFDERLTYPIAFYLITPLAVYLHELGHYVCAWHYGAQDIRIHFYFYYGETTFATQLPSREDWWVYLAGNLVTFALGLIALIAAIKLPMRQLWRCIWLSFAQIQLFLVLVWYPAICLFGGFSGDFTAIYGHDYLWTGTYVVAAVNIIGAAILLYVCYTPQGKSWWEPYFALTEQAQTRTIDEPSEPGE